MADSFFDGLNAFACPSCSRIENERFIELAADVTAMTAHATDHDLTIAVMGCRVNGRGETDDADLGLWCGPKYVGAFTYDEILPRLREQLDRLITRRDAAG